ncbi:DUF1657 domain-containing protein [Thermoflavimicrobium daqui]|jgi:hypothetical protein|uniref:DUF1657 domain-containing protein n=1 Tax=Thermoflavimicrobium daqui TaxID=2137476 RepID=A0A364K0X7_9BACL|nr:DUF1657 domain-containing protein [Thermoflavimicrobium daqui]RAL21349.1 DUF1657 domain-containing protein [Thermoflavimicrobium daqui]
MTTYSRVKQTLVSLKGAQANLERYSLIAQDEAAKKTFQRSAEKLQLITDRLQKRIQNMEWEEPQYKGF